MTALVWDKPGEKTYQTGVDRGVLYLQDGSSAAWNGLTSVEETGNDTLTSYYLDGVKYLDNLTPGDFSGKLKAFTYPDLFDSVNGILSPAEGLFYHDQPVKSFNLSYRTKTGTDLDSDHSYRIHLLYNLIANPDTFAYDSLKEQMAPIEFAWALTGTPPKIGGYRPTVHISIDSGEADPDAFELLENVLYGTDTSDPRIPSINEIAGWFQTYGALIIIDNGDGTWTAVDQADNYITMTNPTTFQIDNADATYLDSSTYQISTTYPD